jgi:hypothetical protein
VLKGSGPEAPEVDPKTVDWSSINSDDFPYRLRQDPGPSNGMGRVKLIFPNKFDVYLHDTPGRHLFEKPQRTFSHGCIRIEKPIDLALYLLRQDPLWSREAFLGELGKKAPTRVVLQERIPIYLVYWTAWADEDGTIQFRPDIYNWDTPLLVAMRAPLTNKEVVGTQNLGEVPMEANKDVPQGVKNFHKSVCGPRDVITTNIIGRWWKNRMVHTAIGFSLRFPVGDYKEDRELNIGETR